MRPAAQEALYKDLEAEFGAQDWELPGTMAIRPLRSSDLDAVLGLEELCFTEAERATREKLAYRLRVCPELCVGVFEREFSWKEPSTDNDVVAVVAPRSTLKSERLVGHIIATKTSSEVVTDESMDPKKGHIETGRTIAIHSLAVNPEYRHRHIGYMMLKDYVQRFYSSSTADGIALIAHEELVPFYRQHGFRNEGKSSVKFGGAKWLDLRLPFP